MSIITRIIKIACDIHSGLLNCLLYPLCSEGISVVLSLIKELSVACTVVNGDIPDNVSRVRNCSLSEMI